MEQEEKYYTGTMGIHGIDKERNKTRYMKSKDKNNYRQGQQQDKTKEKKYKNKTDQDYHYSRLLLLYSKGNDEQTNRQLLLLSL